MERRKRMIIILALLLITSVGSMIRITSNSNIRSVEFVIILATGAIFGLLIHQIISSIKKKDKN